MRIVETEYANSFNYTGKTGIIEGPTNHAWEWWVSLVDEPDIRDMFNTDELELVEEA